MKNYFCLFLCLFCYFAASLCAQNSPTLQPNEKNSAEKSKIDQTSPPSHQNQAEPKKEYETKQSNTSPQLPEEKNLSKGEQSKPGKSAEKKEKEKTSPHTLSTTVAFLSDYRSRGISQTFRRAAVQGELKYTHISGFYFKSWGSNVDGTSHFINNTSLEWDFYLGLQHSFLHPQIKYDTGLLYYYYPGGRARVRANTPYDTLEYYFSLSYKKFEIKLSLTLTDYFANNSSNPPMNWDIRRPVRPNGYSYGSPYLEVNYEYSFSSKWKAACHVGYQAVVNYPQLNYLDWLVSLTRVFEWFEVTVTYVQTNARKAFYNIPDHSFRPKRVDLGGPGVVLAIDKTF